MPGYPGATRGEYAGIVPHHTRHTPEHESGEPGAQRGAGAERGERPPVSDGSEPQRGVPTTRATGEPGAPRGAHATPGNEREREIPRAPGAVRARHAPAHESGEPGERPPVNHRGRMNGSTRAGRECRHGEREHARAGYSTPRARPYHTPRERVNTRGRVSGSAYHREPRTRERAGRVSATLAPYHTLRERVRARAGRVRKRDTPGNERECPRAPGDGRVRHAPPGESEHAGARGEYEPGEHRAGKEYAPRPRMSATPPGATRTRESTGSHTHAGEYREPHDTPGSERGTGAAPTPCTRPHE